jgi:dephospho-CoA kinase
MIVLGLTGSIGMGKSTTAQMFMDEGIALHDADAVVHDLYRSEAVEAVGSAFPGTTRDGVVDRGELARQLADNPDQFARLEAIVHPLVRQKEIRFLEAQRERGSDLVVLDIPLLFESGADKRVDVKIVVTCDPQIQKQRVLARPGMTAQKLDLILARQMPDEQKRRRADFLIDTGQGLEAARQRVRQIIGLLRAGTRSEAHA